MTNVIRLNERQIGVSNMEWLILIALGTCIGLLFNISRKMDAASESLRDIKNILTWPQADRQQFQVDTHRARPMTNG